MAAPHAPGTAPRSRRHGTFSAWIRRVTLLLVVLAISNPWMLVQAGAAAQNDPAEALFESLTPEERVGQLFLTTFQGMQVDEQSQIYDLIVNHHIGGVILTAANDNFTDREDALEQIATMNRELQLARWTASQPSQPITGTAQIIPSAFIPLFIGVAQEGDGYPTDHILSGVTQLPAAMAVGATWDTQTGSRCRARPGARAERAGDQPAARSVARRVGGPQPERRHRPGDKHIRRRPVLGGRDGARLYLQRARGQRGQDRRHRQTLPWHGICRPPADRGSIHGAQVARAASEFRPGALLCRNGQHRRFRAQQQTACWSHISATRDSRATSAPPLARSAWTCSRSASS